jgi:hypothetical protein
MGSTFCVCSFVQLGCEKYSAFSANYCLQNEGWKVQILVFAGGIEYI